MTIPRDKERSEKIEEQLEATHGSIREIITVEVAAAVKGAMAAMQQSLVNRFVASFDEVAKQQDEKLTAAITRLEGRITRSRDTQESLINSMRDDQLRFQSDVRSTFTTLQPVKSKQKEMSEQKEDGLVIGEGSSTGERRGGFGLVGSGIVLGAGSGVNGGDGSCPAYGSGYGSGYGVGSGSGGGPGFNGSGRNSWRHKKLDLPLFDGNNPDGWILRAERFFKFHGLTSN